MDVPAIADLAGPFRAEGIDAVTDPAECAVASADLSGAAERPAGVVLLPADQDQVLRLVRVARAHAIALFPRGGGWSYTAGYRPDGGAIVDVSRLQSIAIDAAGGTVEAGAGVTWATLHETLAAAGLRVPSFGPLSGLGATVGGGAAQNGGFFGNAGHGALGDGTVCGGVLVTGTGAAVRLGPEDRLDGKAAPQPLVGDCGAFGIRTAVVLRTMAIPAETGFASFDFRDGPTAIRVLASLAGTAALGEAYVFDPGTHANLARTGFSVIESAEIAGDLLRGGQGSGFLARLGGLVRTARAGKAFVADLRWSLHVSFDGTAAEVAAARADVTERASAAGGEAIPDVIPRVTRARPFRRIKALLGPDGEAWLPCHGVFPAAGGEAGLAAAQAELARSAPEMAGHGIRAVVLGVLMGDRVVIEPQLFWPDALGPAVRRKAMPDQVAAFGDRPANPAARKAALDLRQRLTAALDAAGATHFQLGRSYAVAPDLRAKLAALKTKFDPDGIINPGALGL